MANQIAFYAIIPFDKEKELQKKIKELELNYYEESPVYFLEYNGTAQGLAKKLGYDDGDDLKATSNQGGNAESGIVLGVSDCDGCIKKPLWIWIQARGLGSG